MTELQVEVSNALRSGVMNEVERRGYSDEQFAEVLDFFPDGVRRLRHQKVWPVDLAIDLAEKLGLSVRIEVADTAK